MVKAIYKDDILRLRSEGKTYKEIQDALGCSKGTISYHLGEGQKEKTYANRKGARKKILNFLIEYKEEHGCQDCGGMYPYFVLDFDHVGEKEFNIAHFRNITMSLEKIKKEIEQCEVVCSNCHRLRTHLRGRVSE